MEITSIERYTIEKVKEKRIAAGLSPRELSLLLGLDASYIAHAENPKYKHKYNLNHLNAFAVIFQCPVKDFIPRLPIPEETKYTLK